jgi:hypothetical protein
MMKKLWLVVPVALLLGVWFAIRTPVPFSTAMSYPYAHALKCTVAYPSAVLSGKASELVVMRSRNPGACEIRPAGFLEKLKYWTKL